MDKRIELVKRKASMTGNLSLLLAIVMARFHQTFSVDEWIGAVLILLSIGSASLAILLQVVQIARKQNGD